jgi:hypothetical protein
MTDRVIVYDGALPQTTDILNSNKLVLVDQSYQNRAVVGTNTAVRWARLHADVADARPSCDDRSRLDLPDGPYRPDSLRRSRHRQQQYREAGVPSKPRGIDHHATIDPWIFADLPGRSDPV